MADSKGRVTLLDQLMRHLVDHSRSGPVKSYELEAIAHTSFGTTPGTVTTRLRKELQPAGFIDKTYDDKGHVQYTCSRQQHWVWRLARETMLAERVWRAGYAGSVAYLRFPPSTPTGSVVDGNRPPPPWRMPMPPSQAAALPTRPTRPRPRPGRPSRPMASACSPAATGLGGGISREGWSGSHPERRRACRR